MFPGVVSTMLPLAPIGRFQIGWVMGSILNAVHAVRSIPQEFKELDDALDVVERDAGVYADLNQLRLIRRGLESHNAITRVAVLGVGNRERAGRLLRTLLADPLASKPDWERWLTEGDGLDNRALILKYHEKAQIEDNHSLVKTILIPSSILLRHNIEILVHSIDANVEYSDPKPLLVPSLDVRNSSSGRTSMVTYPVHKTLICVDNLAQFAAINLSNSINSLKSEHGLSILEGAIDGPWKGLQTLSSEQLVRPINLELSETAVEIFRESLENSVHFEQAWFDSGMPPLSTWLTGSSTDTRQVLKQPLRILLSVVLRNMTQNIQSEALEAAQATESLSISSSARQVLDQGLSIWAENAHTELRDRLDGAFISRSWDKTKWWKLCWRIDEVEFITTDILQRAWLVDAEKEMIWMCGRIHQSGLLGAPKLRPPPPKGDPADEVSGILGAPAESTLADVATTPRSFRPVGDEDLVFLPWPQDISFSRSALARNTIPPLQSFAQKLLLQSISMTALTSTLSSLVYMTVSTASVFEAGTIAGLGLILSIRRLQSRWEEARSIWQTTVRENGKDVLRRAEFHMREVVKIGGRASQNDAEVEQRLNAERAVEEAARQLEKMR